MYSEKYGLLYMITSLEGKVALLGVTLSFLHCAGRLEICILQLFFYIVTVNNQARLQDFSQGGRDFLGTKLFSGIRNKTQEKRYETRSAIKCIEKVLPLLPERFLPPTPPGQI